MNRVTGSRAARSPEDGLPTEPWPDPAAPARTQSVAPPHPRTVPAGGEESAGPELEPTTGAPVDALPRRVPVRPAGGRHIPDAGTPDDDVFWAPIEEVHWDGTPVRPEAPGDGGSRWRRVWRGRRRRATSNHPPDPLPGLAALIGLSLAAAFFAWVSAGPFWVAIGHATPGTVVVTGCSGGGLTQRCRGIFTAADGTFRSHGVRVSGVPAHRTAAGGSLPARVTGPDGGIAYVDRGFGVHLRWLLGLLAVLGCGVGIARWTGATRLPEPRARRWAVIASLAGPLMITIGFLAAAW
ncbi:hypothetical protein GCM10011608_08000 [Micromonospora sonchi]|uniref:Uncharacterized protein n=1 Tax=Micromonospora sonchi TaxID=1763543 RepID=A0A917WSN4_9ACTN|nr:hypothetical protein [Micromonospora sonchi]GGM25518.1 hypothetical protein GCM10011608_08000 [Micromonospora sonchi]